MICALVITGLVLRREFFPPEEAQPQVRQVENWQQLKLYGQRTGPPESSVQIVEFFDYQCPFCKQANPAVQAVKQKYPRQVSVVHEHFPLSGHQYAFGAAVAAECAGRQGKFTSFHDLLFSSQDSLGTLSYSRLAATANIPNTTAFGQCVENEETADIVEFGITLAGKLNVRSIPTFIINGMLVSGAVSEERLDRLVQEALGEARK